MFRAIHKKPTYDPNTHSIVGYEWGIDCGHHHPTAISADDCVNALARKVGLKLYESVIIVPDDESPHLPAEDVQQLASRYRTIGLGT